MDGILDTVMDQLGSGGLQKIGQMLGMDDEQKTKQAVGTAVGVLSASMARNASEPSGRQALDTAVEQDHDGSIFDNVTGFLGDFMSGPGAGILGHVLGNEQPQVESAIAEKSGLSMDKIGPLLMAVAPLVMGALGKLKRDKGLDADGVATTLETETAQIEERDNGIDLGAIIGMVGGLAAGGSSESSGGGGGGGIMGVLGGLFGGKKGD